MKPILVIDIFDGSLVAFDCRVVFSLFDKLLLRPRVTSWMPSTLTVGFVSKKGRMMRENHCWMIVARVVALPGMFIRHVSLIMPRQKPGKLTNLDKLIWWRSGMYFHNLFFAFFNATYCSLVHVHPTYPTSYVLFIFLWWQVKMSQLQVKLDWSYEYVRSNGRGMLRVCCWWV